jgi:hypothetical protein
MARGSGLWITAWSGMETNDRFWTRTWVRDDHWQMSGQWNGKDELSWRRLALGYSAVTEGCGLVGRGSGTASLGVGN